MNRQRIKFPSIARAPWSEHSASQDTRFHPAQSQGFAGSCGLKHTQNSWLWGQAAGGVLWHIPYSPQAQIPPQCSQGQHPHSTEINDSNKIK